jgi:hypothetical protein
MALKTERESHALELLHIRRKPLLDHSGRFSLPRSSELTGFDSINADSLIKKTEDLL